MVGTATLTLLDTTTNTAAGTWALPGLLDLVEAPGGTAVLAGSEKSAVAIDPATGKVTARVDSFQGNTDGRFVARHGWATA